LIVGRGHRRRDYGDVPDGAAETGNLDIITFVEGTVDHDHQPRGQITQCLLHGKSYNERGPAHEGKERCNVHSQGGKHDHQAKSDGEPVHSHGKKAAQQLGKGRHPVKNTSCPGANDPGDEKKDEECGDNNKDAKTHPHSTLLRSQPPHEAFVEFFERQVRFLLRRDRQQIVAQCLHLFWIATFCLQAGDHRREFFEDELALLQKHLELIEQFLGLGPFAGADLKSLFDNHLGGRAHLILPGSGE
jgi:hypothetical protein